jgi:anti-anti-sigma regulatory factor
VDAHAVGTLQNVLLRAAQPWVLDWTPIEVIDVKAARALLGMFTLWGDQDVELRFQGASDLRDLLKTLTPSGRRDIEQLWWELRMAVLRVMNRPDEFELTALDFCVTYEVSPPGWEKPRCHFQGLSSGKSEEGGSVLGEVVLEQVTSGYSGDSGMEGQNSEFNNLGLVELSGEIRGDPQPTLEALERRLQGADVMIISCRNLIRVDFSAAGTLLNWVTGHHSAGRMIQFVDAHRLVSAFFHVIGITEYAKVVVRNDELCSPRAACGVTPQGAALAARRSRFRGALERLPFFLPFWLENVLTVSNFLSYGLFSRNHHRLRAPRDTRGRAGRHRWRRAGDAGQHRGQGHGAQGSQALSRPGIGRLCRCHGRRLHAV